MAHGRPGLDVSTLVRDVLAQSEGPSRLATLVHDAAPARAAAMSQSPDAYNRLFGAPLGQQAVNRIGNESLTLHILSTISLEVVFAYVDGRWPVASGGFGRRVLAVPGAPAEKPTLLVLDPLIDDVSETRRVTDDLPLAPDELIREFQSLRGSVGALDPRLADLFSTADPATVFELLAISQPEIVVTRRPVTIPLGAPSPHLTVRRGAEISSVGVFCRDAAGELGVSACWHGTGDAGTRVDVAGTASVVKHASQVQDIVFIPLDAAYAVPPLRGRAGLRTQRAPSQAELVSFDGAGSGGRVTTRVQSHDAGILRRRATVQLKVQTPADTNPGDSGAALVDADDRIVGFGFERTALGDYPEFTDWIWADNALAALNLSPI